MELNEMRPLRHSSCYIVQAPFSYCFRINVPADLQHLVGKREIRYSLRTGSVGIAKSKARLLAGQIQFLFRMLRKGGPLLSDLSDNRIKEIVQQYLDQYKKGLEDRNLSGQNPFMNEEDFHQYVRDLDSNRTDKIAELGIGDYRLVESIVDGILEKGGIEGVQKGSEDYIKLCRGILRAQIKGIEYEKKFMLEELPEEPAPPKETPPVPIPLPAPPPGMPSITLEKLIEKFWEESLRSKKWSKGTIKEYKNGYKVIVDFLGAGTPVRKIGHTELQSFKEMLMKMPSNFGRSKKYEGMTLKDVLESDFKGDLSVSAMNRYLMNAQALFNYGVRNSQMDFNPATGLQLPKQKKRPSDEKSQFSHEDLIKIFRSSRYLEDDFVQPYMFWLPILGLYTGCRIEELCQLFCSDVAQFKDVWCLDINDDPGKKLKNIPSKRVIPLHPVLIETLNFPGYVQKQADSGHERIFHELKRYSDDYSHAAGKWFNERYKVQIGLVVKEGEKKSFHSFRHTFTNNLKQQLIPLTVVDEITGRKVVGESFGRYGKPYAAKLLLEKAISKLDFGIDLSHLKNSKWVGK